MFNREGRLLGDEKDRPVSDDEGSANQFITAFILIRNFYQPEDLIWEEDT